MIVTFECYLGGAHDCCVCNGFIYYPRIVLCAHEVADDSLNLLVLSG